MNSIILQTENLEKSFSTEYGMHRVLKGISVDFFQGDFTAIMGESGSGKSTLLYALSGMDTPTGGRVLSAGKNLVNMNVNQLAEYRKRHCGFVFQNNCLIPSMNVMDNILISGLLGSNKKKEVIPYDMCKAVQKDMRIENIRLLSKSGGKSGDYQIKE